MEMTTMSKQNRRILEEVKEELRKRDLLWCKTLILSGLDPRDMQKVLAKFNRMRPDKKEAKEEE